MCYYTFIIKKNEKKKRENKNSFETWIPRNQVLESLAKIVSVCVWCVCVCVCDWMLRMFSTSG